MRWPGIEPGSTAWKAAMLAFTPPTPPCYFLQQKVLFKRTKLRTFIFPYHSEKIPSDISKNNPQIFTHRKLHTTARMLQGPRIPV